MSYVPPPFPFSYGHPSSVPCRSGEGASVLMFGCIVQVNEREQSDTVIPVDAGAEKGDDADEGMEPIKGEVNGDVEGGVAGGASDGADLDPADQTLVGDVSQDPDLSLIKEIVVSGVSRTLDSDLCIYF